MASLIRRKYKAKDKKSIGGLVPIKPRKYKSINSFFLDFLAKK